MRTYVLVLGAVSGLIVGGSVGSGTAHAQMVAGSCTPPATCAPYDKSAGICDTEVYACDPINLGELGGTIYLCESTTYSKPPVGTACESDSNPCTTDACGGTVGTATGNGVCMHSAVANGTGCGTNSTCQGGVCNCAGGYTPCSGGCIPSTTCCSDANCTAGGHVCNGVGGSCVCPAGQYDCSGTCISTATCCVADANCSQPTSGNGTASCPSNGGTCVLTCNGGYHACGAVCEPCCVDTDCPNNATNNQHGVCAASVCALQCNSGYKPCGTTCIPMASCCSNTDCTNTTDPCHMSTGTCTAGACKFANNDGAACNADSSKCTPNDSCSGGACVADTAHKVTCVNKDCQNNLGCNATTGNCGYSNFADGTGCGGNGCNAAAGKCASGACSAPPKDCSASDTDCTTGACDPTKGIDAPCTVSNKTNGTTCNLSNRCFTATACSGGSCIGTAVTCTPSGACRSSTCEMSSGTCTEIVVTSGSCSEPGSCMQNATCNTNGDCVGDPVPDNTPCELMGCATESICLSSKCTCVAALDFSAPPMTVVPTGDMGPAGKASHKSGCSLAPGAAHSRDGALVVFLLLAFVFVRRRVTMALFVCVSVASIASPAGAQTCPPAVYPCYTQNYVYQCGNPEVITRTTPKPDLCTNGHCEPTTIKDQPVNTPCTDDSNPCTADVCNGTGTCTHNNATGGSVCGSVCIAPGTCCSNASCTNGMTCSGVGGTCGCPANTTLCGSTCIANGTCCSDANCTGGNVCSGVGGTCGCPAGSYLCAGACIANNTCCTSPNNCPPPTSGAGTDTCPSNGGTCSFVCGSGLKQCGTACASCCVDTDCPNNATNNQHGVCGAGGCGLACNTGYKVCGATCIANAQCCSSADCTNTTDPCHVQQGTCASGACTYANNDGAACNADSNACTPNDTCSGGKCIADSAHAVTCLNKDCQTNMGCQPASGNCLYTNVTDGTTCGSNGCNSGPGTCTTGKCSAPPKDCSSLDTDCTLGACDPSKPTGSACTVTNKMNGITCGSTNKCVPNPICSGGVCGGTQTVCTPSGACRESACSPTSGSCVETIADAGTSCAVSCTQGATCDSNGTCSGDPVPDETPCDKSGCTVGAECTKGVCNCVGVADFAGHVAPTIPDASGTVTSNDGHHKGCSAAPGTPTTPSAGSLVLLFYALTLVLAARRARAHARPHVRQ